MWWVCESVNSVADFQMVSCLFAPSGLEPSPGGWYVMDRWVGEEDVKMRLKGMFWRGVAVLSLFFLDLPQCRVSCPSCARPQLSAGGKETYHWKMLKCSCIAPSANS